MCMMVKRKEVCRGVDRWIIKLSSERWSTGQKSISEEDKEFSKVVIVVAVQLLSCVQLFATSWTATHQPSLSFTIFQSLLKFISIESVKWSEAKSLSHIWLFATPWTVAYQAPLSMGFPRQEYWSELPFPSPGDLPEPGNETVSCTAGGFFTAEP